MNIITKLKNICKKAQRAVSLWQAEHPKRLMLGIDCEYNDGIQDIADAITFGECWKLNIRCTHFVHLVEFLRSRNDNSISPRQMNRLLKAAKKQNKFIDSLHLKYGKKNEDLRTIHFHPI